MGCNFAQGYYYSRPVSPPEITLMIQRGRFNGARTTGEGRRKLLAG
jgi:hypothetical protein